jgi:hypothetical protein
MRLVNFTTASDRATRSSITLADIAAACDVSLGKVHRARMDPDSPHARRPPDNWRTCVARLCRERAEALVRLAEQLEREA